jgi:hypothetical protein
MLTDIQKWWISEHNNTLCNARLGRVPMQALFDMYERYECLNDFEKPDINQLFIYWVDESGLHNINNDELYTALACIEKYRIISAIPAMQRLVQRLDGCVIPDNPQGFYEREKVLRKLEKLSRPDHFPA